MNTCYYLINQSIVFLGGFSLDEALKLKRATYHLWTFAMSKLISSFGAQVYAFAISFYILQLIGSATNFAVNLICNILPRTVVAPFAGYVADNYSRKKIGIIAQVATTLAIGGLLVISLTMGLSLIAIYTTTAILSLTTQFSNVAFSSSITGLVDEKRIQRAMSLNQISISFAAIGSPAIGGLLYGLVSMPVFLLMYVITSTLAVVLESTMNFNLFAKRKEIIEGQQKETMLQNMKAGISYLKLQPVLMDMIWISLAINFLLGAFIVGYAFILIEKMKISSVHFGLTEGAFAVGMLIMSIYFSMRKDLKYPLLIGKRGILGIGFLMSAITLPLLIKMPYEWMFAYYAVIMFGFGVMQMVANTPLMVWMQKTIDDDYKGRVFSILETMAMALMPLGMVIYGFLYDVLSAQWILIASSIALITVVLILARPSVILKAHPELATEKHIK